MGAIQVLESREQTAWLEIFSKADKYDVYRLPDYHSMIESLGEGRARLFAFKEGDYSIAVPLLLRPISQVPGLETIDEPWMDATSVYGYAGPAASHADIPKQILAHFRDCLRESLLDDRIVTVFSRFLLLVHSSELTGGMGEAVDTGQTVSIDLTQPLDSQYSQYRKGHREGINKLRRICVIGYSRSFQRFTLARRCHSRALQEGHSGADHPGLCYPC
jgi:hypothetical protein